MKGSGAANCVYEYNGKNSGKIDSNIIRVRKSSNAADGVESNLKSEVWADISHVPGGCDSLEGDVLYIRNILSPIIGNVYIPAQAS